MFCLLYRQDNDSEDEVCCDVGGDTQEVSRTCH